MALHGFKHYLVTCPLNMPNMNEITYVEHPVLLPSEIIMWLLDTKNVTLPDITNMSHKTRVALNKKDRSIHVRYNTSFHIIHEDLVVHGDGCHSKRLHTTATQLCQLGGAAL